MIPVGYMAKRLPVGTPEWLKAPQVNDVYSVSSCVNDDFADYIPYWKHNDWWFFDSPELIEKIAHENDVSIYGTKLFYYEVYELEFHHGSWESIKVDSNTNVLEPSAKMLEGFDVVTYSQRSSPECSPLSCNSLASEIQTNTHCLFESLNDALAHLNAGAFNESEPGPYRVMSVYSVDSNAWPSNSFNR